MSEGPRPEAHGSSSGFESRYQQLLDLTGLVPDDLVEPDDEHEEHKRFAVYRRLVDRVDLWPLLLSCLADDPDPLMASDVLARVLERVDASQRAAVVDAASGWPGVFAGTVGWLRERARELDTLDALRGDPPGPDALASLARGSDWLQERAAREIDTPQVLGVLEAQGRTRRVRTTAREKRLDQLGAGRRDA